MEDVITKLKATIFKKYCEAWSKPNEVFPSELASLIQGYKSPITLFVPTNDAFLGITENSSVLKGIFKSLIFEKDKIDKNRLKGMHKQFLSSFHRTEKAFSVTVKDEDIRIGIAHISGVIDASNGIIYTLGLVPKKNSMIN